MVVVVFVIVLYCQILLESIYQMQKKKKKGRKNPKPTPTQNKPNFLLCAEVMLCCCRDWTACL